MKVSEALATRISCRAFLDTPVPEEKVRGLLDAAKQSASGGNLQPWHVYVLTGEPLREFVALMEKRWQSNPAGEGSEYDIYPKNLGEPYRTRRFECGEDLYATLGIPREDKRARVMQVMRNFRFFDAPVGLFFAIDRQMGIDQWMDIGMFQQSIMLAAREQGLHTCPQEAWAIWHKTVAEFVGMPPELMLCCGMALGYMDESAPVNGLRTRRASLDEFATLRGF
ncbi:nitroreductase [Solimonas sp. SE-A11]|uniref:nitroreductase n=1 Tax=Solimonas sp. SE-A11 TaxID=3054954 RepID=UPI00259C8C38|nr:nitroreductase [Solimonas sp. SE-A11]